MNTYENESLSSSILIMLSSIMVCRLNTGSYIVYFFFAFLFVFTPWVHTVVFNHRFNTIYNINKREKNPNWNIPMSLFQSMNIEQNLIHSSRNKETFIDFEWKKKKERIKIQLTRSNGMRANAYIRCSSNTLHFNIHFVNLSFSPSFDFFHTQHYFNFFICFNEYTPIT